MQWFATKQIPMLVWPAYSPDLNPIDNLWGILLVREVYKHGRQFSSCNELKVEKFNARCQISSQTLETMVKSVSVFTVINKNGRPSKLLNIEQLFFY
jgi:hypothetical protein